MPQQRPQRSGADNSMSESSRDFPAAGFAGQLAVLSVGVERLPVKLVENPNGGLSICAQKPPDFPCDSFAELACSDGQSFSGQIKYIEQTSDGFRIGFERREMIDTSYVDLRDAFSLKTEKGVPVLTYAMVLFIGLGFGWILVSGYAAEIYDRVSKSVGQPKDNR
jgi:hypothetical protein